ncbi:MAG: roadblock/LC7 domain-containing protein [Candidatus Nanopelagicales bacterium]|nr:roadblock/LC7 domain-containing protein [Candidatus Nanopelagicales bacterium]
MADIEVPHPGASDIVGRLLGDALSEHPDVQWIGLVSEDGFAIASEGAVAVDDDAVAAGAVRMMVQVRTLSKALGQSSTSQMFLEGAESGICVIDKDPWVLVVVGAPGVPIGLLRYEAREIAEAFPMGQRTALTAGPIDLDGDDALDPEWSVVTGSFPEGTFGEEALDVAAGSADDSLVTVTDAGPEIQWGEEPETFGAPSADIFASVGTEDIESLEMPSAGDTQAEDLSAWDAPAPLEHKAMFDLPAPDAEVPVTFEMPESGTGGSFDLADLPAPMGPAIDLPPPMGPAFQLPPPV